MATVKFIDLFAGIGGLRTGFEQAFNEAGINTECVLTSEIKKHAIKVLEKNYDHGLFVGDITKVNNKDIPDFDFLLAGFPCQAFSSAGKRLGFLDTRGTLFFEVERILRDKRPYGFILENVEGLVTHERKDKNKPIGETLEIILASLRSLGYKVSWKVLDSQYFGVPQSRKRIFITGTLNQNVNLEEFTERKTTLRNILETGVETIESNFTRKILAHYPKEYLYGKNIKDKRGGAKNIHSWDFELKGPVSPQQHELLNLLLKQRRNKKWASEIGIKWMDGMPLTLEQIRTFYDCNNLKELLDDLVAKKYLAFEHPKDIIDKNKGRQYRTDLPKGYNIVTGKLSFEFNCILDPDGITPTIVATDVIKIGVIDGDGIRQLTKTECARLFGFADDFDFNLDRKTQIFDLLGNTVVINVAKAVSQRVRDCYLNRNVYKLKQEPSIIKEQEESYNLFTYQYFQ